MKCKVCGRSQPYQAGGGLKFSALYVETCCFSCWWSFVPTFKASLRSSPARYFQILASNPPMIEDRNGQFFEVNNEVS